MPSGSLRAALGTSHASYILHFSGDAVIPDSRSHLSRCQALLNKISAVSPQTEIDGLRNIWIVKPAAKSRGRGESAAPAASRAGDSLLWVQRGCTPGSLVAQDAPAPRSPGSGHRHLSWTDLPGLCSELCRSVRTCPAHASVKRGRRGNRLQSGWRTSVSASRGLHSSGCVHPPGAPGAPRGTDAWGPLSGGTQRSCLCFVFLRRSPDRILSFIPGREHRVFLKGNAHEISRWSSKLTHASGGPALLRWPSAPGSGRSVGLRLRCRGSSEAARLPLSVAFAAPSCARWCSRFPGNLSVLCFSFGRALSPWGDFSFSLSYVHKWLTST